ncbi:ATP-dependent RNA helicase [Apiospora saccharicola]|uniref:ATP-dependent RNA helicase n=1 Tax=Apiospora saccharicola TaxID=335842 RepID=A0ABR1W1C5_9PEZI
MYARYIPPAKPAAPKPAPAPVAERKPGPPPGIIAQMAPAAGAYGRYIPGPKLEDVAKMNKKIVFGDDDDEPPVKKVKVATEDLKDLSIAEETLPIRENEATDEKKDKKKKKKSKKDKTKDSTTLDESDAVVEAAAESPAKETTPEPPAKEKSPEPAEEKTPELPESPVEEKKKKREKKKKSKAETETPDANVDEPVKSSHKGVFERKAKSMKAPEENTADFQGDGEDVPMADAPEPEEVHGLEPLPQPEPRAPEPPSLPQTELPSWLHDHVKVSRDATAAFTSFGLKPEYGITAENSKRLEAKGYKEAHAVQTAVIPQLLPHHDIAMHSDILVSAETGSGKTLAYALPIIRDLSHSGSPCTFLRAIVVVPSKNLAQQAQKVCEECADIFHDGTRRVKVGIATGRRLLDEEKSALVERRERYDPEGYQKRLERVKTQSRRARYEDDSEDEERNEILRREDRIKTLPNHVIEYVSKVDILICTPGRLVEHINLTPGFNLDDVRWLVLDEADKFFGQNYNQFLDVVIPRLHSNSNKFQRSHMQSRLTGVRKVILSASMTTDLDKLGPLKLRKPKLVEMASGDRDEAGGRDTMLNLPATLRESAIKVDLELKPLFLLDLLESDRIMSGDTEDSSSDSDSSSADTEASLPPKMLIFTKTRENAIRLARLLAIMAPKLEPVIGCITSDSTDKKQTRALKAFRAGKLRIIIASDLIARGIDLPNVKHVINYDMPNSVTSYVHRVGRTARAQRSGHAWTLFTFQEARWFWNDVAGKEIGRTREVERVRITEEKEDEEAFEKKKARFEAAVAQLAKEGGA